MNKEKILKFLSINLILVFILSIINLNQVSYASITENQNKGKIKISNIESGVDVYLYQIATTDYDYTASQPKDGYNWNSAIKSWIDENYPEYSNSEDFYNKIESNSDDARMFYDELTASIKDSTIKTSVYASKKASGTALYPVTIDNLRGNCEFTNVDMGTYLVIIENGYMVYTPSVINVIPSFNKETNKWVLEDQNVIIKATKPTITKTVTNEEKTVDNYSTTDEITYTIKADVPTYLENSLSKNYYISDKLDRSLTINEESVAIYGLREGHEPESIIGHEIRFNTTRPEGPDTVTFLIDFDYSKICLYDTIKIVYTAKLNKDSVIGIIGNNNYSYLDYSNNPYNKTSLQTQTTNKVSVYTYGIEVKSVNGENNEELITGSEFALYDEEGHSLYFIPKEDGKYYLADPEDEGATTNLKVGKDGELYLYGLDEGVYKIEQTKAPEGYKVSSKTYKIELVDNQPDGELDDDYTLIFPNTKGFILPLTGGKGIIYFICVGTTLIGIGLLLLISITKKRKKFKKNI